MPSLLIWFNYLAVLHRVVADWGLSGLRAGVVFGAVLGSGGFALAFRTLAAGALVALGALMALRYTGYGCQVK